MELIYSVLQNPRRAIICIDPSESLATAIRYMTEHDIGALVVQNEGKLHGILSERDVMRSCFPGKCDFNAMRVSDVVHTAVTLLDIDDPIERAMEAMTKTKRRHVLVTEKGELIAMLSIGDILFYLLENKSKLIQHLKNYIAS